GAAAGESPTAEVLMLIEGARRDLAHLRFQEARDKAVSATGREPANAKAHAQLGISYIGLRDLAAGDRELKQAITLDGNTALAHAGFGILYYSRALSIAGSAAGSSTAAEVQKLLR